MARNANAEVNRPFATRLIEQAVVAVIAGGGSAYGVAEVTQARHDEQIKSLQVQFERNSAALQRQFERSEDRLMREIQIIRDGKNGR